MEKMSFSAKVKEELSTHMSSARHCQIAELAAIISICGRISISSSDRYRVTVHTENITVARKYFTLIKKTFNICTETSIRKNLKKGSVFYSVIIARHEEAVRVLQAVKLLDDTGEIREELSIVKNVVIRQLCCRRAFLRGVFLASGSISDPYKSYHFEVVCATEDKAKQLQYIMNSLHMSAKIVLRKKSYVVYLKEADQISDMLNIMEAHVALMEFVYIRDEIGFEKLADGLREVALARIAYPEATLKELGDALTPPVGKSGVNHRLRKLSEIAEKVRANKEVHND